MPGKSTGRKSKNCGTQAGSDSSVVIAKDKGIQVGTYPDTAEKAQATMEKGKKGMFPKFTRCDKQVYLFMRGKKELLQRLKNAFVRDKRVVENFGGTLMGIADQITRCECDLYRSVMEQCLVIIMFPDMDHAQRWVESSRAFKQKDFPSPADEMEIFAVPVNYLPSEDLRAFQMTEMCGLCIKPEVFQKEYVDKVSKLMNAEKIYHGVVATHNITRLRNCMIRPETFVLLNCADSEKKLRDFYDSKEYCEFRDFRQKYVAENDSCIFSIQPITS